MNTLLCSLKHLCFMLGTAPQGGVVPSHGLSLGGCTSAVSDARPITAVFCSVPLWLCDALHTTSFGGMLLARSSLLVDFPSLCLFLFEGHEAVGRRVFVPSGGRAGSAPVLVWFVFYLALALVLGHEAVGRRVFVSSGGRAGSAPVFVWLEVC